MQALFILLAGTGSLHFFLRRKTFDYFSVAYFSAVVYFLPGFFGNAIHYVGGVWTETPMHPEVYWVMIFVMMSILLSSLIAASVPRLLSFNMALPRASDVSYGLCVVSLIGLGGLLLTSGTSVLDPDKDMVLASLNRWHILFYATATLGMPLAFHAKRRAQATLFLLLLMFNLYMGFRSPLAMSTIATLAVLLHSKGPRRLLLTNWKIIFISLVFGAFMFGYKMVAYAVKAGLWDAILEHLGDDDAFLYMLIHSEPFLVQQTLNEVIMNNFKTGHEHITSGLYQLLLFAPELGAENVTFNDMFQPVLFPDVTYGLAANIWAQMWSAGGWPLLVLFTIIFNLVLAVGNLSLASRSVVLKAGLAPIFCYWAFYIHRNELTFTLALEKRLLLLLSLVVVVAAVVRAAATRPTGAGVAH